MIRELEREYWSLWIAILKLRALNVLLRIQNVGLLIYREILRGWLWMLTGEVPE